MPKRFLLLALAIVGIAAAGTLTWNIAFEQRGREGYDVILGLTVFAIAVVTFFGFLVIGHSRGGGWQLTKGGLRTAIAATLVVTYLFLVSFAVYLVPPKDVSPIAETFIQSFTTTVAITIGFYFSASAAVQIFRKEESQEESTTKKGDEP
jgi:hypothetical protein